MKVEKPVIEVKKLSKVYNIGHEQASAPGTLTFRDSLTQTLRKPLEIFTGHRIQQEKFWALKDVNFEVNKGDVVGIIGRNGSGKSTLLKVLSRIVEPTEGEITMRGRVASLLEVGTGFHPELTGRENVYFNGAILGMSQKEIKSKFDEIVAFSEVEKFLDTPVKFYSSGMYVRLAFAVAAHLDPDILIVDEVLAVGDAAFQKKCLGKMKDVAGQGRTVLFVSHNAAAIRNLCTKGILMKAGNIIESGDINKVLETYQKDTEGMLGRNVPTSKTHIKTLEARQVGSNVEIEAVINVSKLDKEGGLVVGFGVDDSFHNRLATFVSDWDNLEIPSGKEKVKVGCLLKDVHLLTGDYYLSSSVSRNGNTSDYIDGGVSFSFESKAQTNAQRTVEHGSLLIEHAMRINDV